MLKVDEEEAPKSKPALYTVEETTTKEEIKLKPVSKPQKVVQEEIAEKFEDVKLKPVAVSENHQKLMKLWSK